MKILHCTTMNGLYETPVHIIPDLGLYLVESIAANRPGCTIHQGGNSPIFVEQTAEQLITSLGGSYHDPRT